jgi:hypothetical protein
MLGTLMVRRWAVGISGDTGVEFGSKYSQKPPKLSDRQVEITIM